MDAMMQLKNTMEPDEAMTLLKKKVQMITDEELKGFYAAGMTLLKKYQITGQIAAAKKLLFHLACCEKEHALLQLGLSKYVMQDDVKFYMEQVNSNVKLVELPLYEREIPDEIVKVIEQVKPIFGDGLWVLYTDYSMTEKDKKSQQAAVDRARMSKDPILFGVFYSEEDRTMNERYYVLADWIDEYCDLTMEKFMEELRKHGKDHVDHDMMATPKDLAEMKEQLSRIQLVKGKYEVVAVKKKPFFQRVRSFLKGE